MRIKRVIIILINLEVKGYNSMIQNFCSSLIFLEQYPRCQVNIVVHVLSFVNETMVLLFNLAIG
jgi:hypothetical protein